MLLQLNFQTLPICKIFCFLSHLLHREVFILKLCLIDFSPYAFQIWEFMSHPLNSSYQYNYSFQGKFSLSKSYLFKFPSTFFVCPVYLMSHSYWFFQPVPTFTETNQPIFARKDLLSPLFSTLIANLHWSHQEFSFLP